MAAENRQDFHRLTLRLTEDQFSKLSYWAGREGCSINELVPEMLDLYASVRSGDYSLPTLEQKRLEQLIERMDVLARNVGLLDATVTSGFQSLLNLTVGDNYLLEKDDT